MTGPATEVRVTVSRFQAPGGGVDVTIRAASREDLYEAVDRVVSELEADGFEVRVDGWDSEIGGRRTARLAGRHPETGAVRAGLG